MVRPDDDEPTADELREAQELARLLDGDEVGDRAFEARAPELEAAALLRYSTGAGELPLQRETEILDRILSDADRASATEAAREPAVTAAARRPSTGGIDWGRAWRWFFGVGGLAAAAAIVLIVVRPWRSDVGPGGPTRLPAPSIELLRAQASAASEGGSIAGLSGAMRSYRSQVFDALGTRYRNAQSAELSSEPHERWATAMCDDLAQGAASEPRPSRVSVTQAARRVSRPRARRVRPMLAHAWVERFAK